MIWLLGFLTGASMVSAVWMCMDIRAMSRKHEKHVREWQYSHNGCGIIRTRRRRADRYKDYAPLPMDLYKQQMKQAKCARLKRIDGRWSA